MIIQNMNILQIYPNGIIKIQNQQNDCVKFYKDGHYIFGLKLKKIN